MTTEHDKALQIHASRCLHLIRSAFPDEVRMTLLVRRPDDPSGDAALMLSDDDTAEAARVIGLIRTEGRETLPGGQIIEEPAPELAPDEAAAAMLAAGLDPTGPLPNITPEVLQFLATRVDDTLNGDAAEDPERKRWGFALFTFEFGPGGSKPVFHVSSAARAYIMPLVRAWLDSEDAEAAATGDDALRGVQSQGRA